MCDFLSGSNIFLFLSAARDFYNQLVPPNFPRKCPLSKGKYIAQNITISGSGEKLAQKINNALTVGELPNGLYRHAITLSNEEDPIGATICWHTLINIRMNEDKF